MPDGSFLDRWGQAAHTSLGFFWMALWAFALGYLVSSLVQVFVTERRMEQAMGKSEGRGVLLGTLFGFINSSCSFSALATTKSLFQKGASFMASLAFLLASTNLVIELGILIALFLGWQFVVGEYVGGLLLIAITWGLVAVLRPDQLVRQARERLQEAAPEEEGEPAPLRDRLSDPHQWARVGMRYRMEWDMVWKDVSVGFTVAGIVAAFVPDAFFQTLFVNTGPGHAEHTFPEVLQHALVAPAAAFLTFIGSMGNIPLAAVLFGSGVSFAGVMAFIFSDLVVFPVLRINARYYGWRMSLFILALLLVALVAASLLLYYGLAWTGYLPEAGSVRIQDTTFFAVDHTLWLNLAFVLASAGILWHASRHGGHHHGHAMAPKSRTLEQVLRWAAYVSYVWLAVGIGLYLWS